MNCLCIWLSRAASKEQSPEPNELECHFNLWILNGIDRKKHALGCFLDVGIMLHHAVESTHINIFIPDQIDKSNVQDLGLIFKDRTELVSAVFNEDYGVLTHAKDKTIEVQKSDATPIFDIYMLDIENDVSIERQFGGSTICIRIPDHLKNKEHYYRIRLKCPFVNQTGYVYTPPPSSILEGAFSQTEVVDFRLNEKRNLPDSLLETIRQNGEVCFTKTHFFLMREARDDYIFSHKPPGGRQLEKDIWKTYVGEDCQFEQITAYHWKDSAPHDNFSVFVKFRTLQSNLRMILLALGIIIIVGIISGFLGNYFYSLFTK